MPKNKPFRFEKFWLSHLDFIQLIEKWWNEPVGIRGTKMYRLQSKLRYIKDKIKIWNKTVFVNIFKEKSNLEGQLEEIHKGWITGDINSETVNKEKMLMQQWQLRFQQEETLWKEKSHIQWIKEGEQNTKFFHRSAMDYGGANKILSLKNE